MCLTNTALLVDSAVHLYFVLLHPTRSPAEQLLASYDKSFTHNILRLVKETVLTADIAPSISDILKKHLIPLAPDTDSPEEPSESQATGQGSSYVQPVHAQPSSAASVAGLYSAGPFSPRAHSEKEASSSDAALLIWPCTPVRLPVVPYVAGPPGVELSAKEVAPAEPDVGELGCAKQHDTEILLEQQPSTRTSTTEPAAVQSSTSDVGHAPEPDEASSSTAAAASEAPATQPCAAESVRSLRRV